MQNHWNCTICILCFVHVYVFHSYQNSEMLHKANSIDFILLLDIAYSINTLYFQVLMSEENWKTKELWFTLSFPFLLCHYF